MLSGNIDLVRGMLDVERAAVCPKISCPLDADDDGAIVAHSGHAIEARIYAEDPLTAILQLGLRPLQ